MGSEVSTESGKNNGSRNTIMRTNSLKDVNIENEDNTRKHSTEGQKVGKPVRRSNTFSGLSGVRPQITRRSKKKGQPNRDAFIAEDVCLDVTNDINLDFNTEKNYRNNNDEDLFIPTKNNYGTSESPTSITETMSFTSNDIKIDEEVQEEDKQSPTFDQRLLEQNSTILETNLTTCDSSGSDKETQRRAYRSNASLDDAVQCRYNNKRSKDELITNPNEDVVDGKETKVKTSHINAEKKKKIARSKSLVSSNKYISVVEERYNSELDDEDTTQRTADKTREDGSVRRTSDSYLLREQHVKKSEQFSAMLKQIRETRKPKSQQLSPYALGAIAGRMSPQSPTPRHLRQNDYFDSWIKDQSERINNLAQALRGDEFKVNEFRSSFRERGLQSNHWELLPVRPNSDRLPRRRINVNRVNKYMSSDTEDEFDNKPFSGASYGKPKSRSHDGEMLTKQLSETFFLLDNSFKNSKKDLPLTERSSGSSLSSLSYRISNSTFSDYGTLEERSYSSEVDNTLILESSTLSGIS